MPSRVPESRDFVKWKITSSGLSHGDDRIVVKPYRARYQSVHGADINLIKTLLTVCVQALICGNICNNSGLVRVESFA
jgi:hypothetical protein